MLSLPSDLPMSRYRLTFRMQSDLKLPVYAGSTLRGVWGHALLNTVCVCGKLESHHVDCPYRQIFSAPPVQNLDLSQKNTPPQSYVIEAPLHGKTLYQSGEDFVFNMVLFGQTRLLLPLIIFAWQHAFSSGVGSLNGRGRLLNVELEKQDGWHSIWQDKRLKMEIHNLVLPNQYLSDVRVVLKTPLWIQQKGQMVLPQDMTADIFLRQVMRRVSTIAHLYFDEPLQADYARLSEMAKQVEGQFHLHRVDRNRYSNRQGQNMKFRGVVGTLVLRGLPPEFAALLYIGQWTHIGKEAVFGWGGYEIQAA